MLKLKHVRAWDLGEAHDTGVLADDAVSGPEAGSDQRPLPPARMPPVFHYLHLLSNTHQARMCQREKKNVKKKIGRVVLLHFRSLFISLYLLL